MSGIIDFHTHAFPDRVASAAIPALEAEGNIRAHLAKPFTRIALAEVIAQVLVTRSPSSP